MEDTITNLLKKIPKAEPGQRFVLGIDGLSRSGKTTFVRKLEQHMKNIQFKVCTFHIDDYIVERKNRYNTGFEEWYEYYHLQWDVEWLKEHLFQRLKETEELKLLTYDNVTNQQVLTNIKIPDTCFIIIEGVFLQRKEWRNHFDYMIYLDSSRETRFNRESDVTQKNIKKFENRYWKAEDYYLDTVSPIEQADYVIVNGLTSVRPK